MHAAVGVFGNRGGAHALLDYAGAERTAFESILMFTDRPPELDASEFPRIIAGYSAGDRYVVQLTVPDERARRPGMVRTIALLLPVGVVGDISLARAAEVLTNALDAESVPLSMLSASPATDARARAAPLIDALLTSGVACWTGDGFEEAVGAAWDVFEASERAHFVFGSAAHPDGISIPRGPTALTVVRASERHASRWNWPRITSSAGTPPSRAAQAYLDPDDPARRLADVLTGATPAFGVWRHMVAAQERLARLEQLDHVGARALAQLLVYLAPDPARGSDVKEGVVRRLAELTPRATLADVEGLRAIDWHKLSPTPALQTLVAMWCRAVWQDARRTRDLAAAVAASENSSDELLATVATELRNAARAQPEAVRQHATAAVAFGEDGLDLLRWLIRAVSRARVDRALAEAPPPSAPAGIVEFALSERLARTHAATVPVADAVRAWEEQLGLGRGGEAAQLLARRIGPAGTVTAAVTLGDASLIARAGELVASDPDLLPEGVLESAPARAVWEAAVDAGGDAWARVDPREAAGVLLDDVLAGQPVGEGLMRALASSPGANVARHPRRAELWQALPAALRETFLAATAPAVATDLAAGGEPPEPELERQILSAGSLGQLARRDARYVVALLKQLPKASPRDALVVMRAARFDPPSAEAFGDLVRARRWKQVAHALVDAESTRADLRPAADRAQSLLGLRDRVKRAVGLGDSVRAIATNDELRAALLELAAELYPQGPAQRALWERAGGSDSDVPAHETPRERWRAALRATFKGAHGAPEPHALMAAMAEDFPRNDELSMLTAALCEAV